MAFSKDLALLLALGAVLVGCAWPLDDAPAPSAAAVATLPGCPLLQNTLNLQGSTRAVTLAGGQTLWVFAGAVQQGDRWVPGLALSATPTDPCYESLAVSMAFAPTGVLAAAHAGLLDVVSWQGGAAAFYQAWVDDPSRPFGVRILGSGLAEYDSNLNMFIANDQLLWLSDAPPYGQSALVWNGDLYAYGCVASDGGWGRSCYLARAAIGERKNSASWQYASDLAKFNSDPSEAVAVLVHAGDASVRHNNGQWEVLYVAPLGADVVLRRGLTPWGPFFAPHTLGRCAVADGEFCSAPQWQPLLDNRPNDLSFSWSRSSFSPLAMARVRPHWTQLATPPEIP